ncbi:MAG TPA: DUF2779 domain-containing protein [Chloroflexota bacterium]|nr:DUF2779 domain-containing protein [Chloroflexota bacterium]
MLTKTTYLTFTQCRKAFWLAEYQSHLASPPDPATQRRLCAGQEVDVRAREEFPDGRAIPYRPHPEEMAPLTAQAIAAGATTLFQATFHVEDLLVKVDILTRTDSGWHLVEVKSSNTYKPEEHLADVAFQWYVLQQAGLPLAQASLMHLNSDCRYPDLRNLFSLTDITAEVQAHQPPVAADISVMREVIEQTETPVVGIGRYCQKPYTCSYYAHCWQGVDSLTIYDVPHLKRPKEQQLETGGIRYVADIPPDFALGDKRAVAFVRQWQQQQITIDPDAIRRELETLVYPLYFFDFETIDYPIPLFTGCKPYQHAPFQYSCHVLHADGALTHHDYLHTAADDPRRPLLHSLLDHIGETGSIVVYYAPFEKARLLELADAFPEYAPRLLGMVNRLWDQLDIFKKYYRDYRFGGSNSLKSVLPVVAPALSYQSLAVQNGEQAQTVWEQMIGEGDTAVKDQLAGQLRAYCHLDTLAMVEIHRMLSNL